MSKEDSRHKGLFSHLNVEKRDEERRAHWAFFKPSLRSLLEAVNTEVYNGDWCLKEKDGSLVLESKYSTVLDYTRISVQQGIDPKIIVITAGHHRYRTFQPGDCKTTVDTEESIFSTVRERMKEEGISQPERKAELIQEEIVLIFSFRLKLAIGTIERYRSY